MTISDIKSEVASLLAERRGGALATSSGSPIPLKVVAIGGAVGLVGFFVLPRLFAAPATASRADTGNAQIDQAMLLLQQQQDINRELLKGQQELNAQMIEAQSKAKTVQPSVNCILAVCPGTGQQESAPDGQYAIVGEGIRTARVDPNQFMQGMTGQAPQPPQQPAPQLPSQLPPTQNAAYQSIPIAAAPDAVEAAYRQVSELWVSDPKQFYNLAWSRQAAVMAGSADPTDQALIRFFQDNPETRVY